jgi:peptide/nickel transport system permease protein
MLDAQAQRVPVGQHKLALVTARPPSSPLMPTARERQAEWIEATRRLLGNRKGLIGTLILLALVVVAAIGPLLMPFDPNELHLADQLAPPSPACWFGTDELGRDILSRLIAGAPVALEAGIVATLLAGAVGTVTGIPAAYFGGWFDAVVMRFWDTMLALPAIFLAIAIVAVLGTWPLRKRSSPLPGAGQSAAGRDLGHDAE